MAALSERGRAFVALDLPGHGLSEGQRCHLAEVTDAVLAVAAAFGPIDAAVAHSFATGGTALAVTEGLPARRLVLIAPPLGYRAPGDVAGNATDAAHQRWRRIASELGFGPEVGDTALDVYRASLGPTRRRFDLSDGLRELAAEVLLLASVDDERFDVLPARQVAAQAANVEFIELVGLDHRRSARGGTAVDAMVQFLEQGISQDARVITDSQAE